MITINIFQVSPDRSLINISVETSTGNKINSIKLWTDETFKNTSSAINLNGKIQGINNKEVFSISASDLGISSFNGIYFIEVTSTNDTTDVDTCNECDNLTLLGVTANLGYFDECLLDNILEVHYDTSDVDNNNQLNDIYNISKLIDAIKIAIRFGYYHNAIDVLSTLKIICRERNGCSQCGTLPDPTFKSGLNFGVIGNNLVLR